jgi:hypothetical protein
MMLQSQVSSKYFRPSSRAKRSGCDEVEDGARLRSTAEQAGDEKSKYYVGSAEQPSGSTRTTKTGRATIKAETSCMYSCSTLGLESQDGT